MSRAFSSGKLALARHDRPSRPSRHSMILAHRSSAALRVECMSDAILCQINAFSHPENRRRQISKLFFVLLLRLDALSHAKKVNKKCVQRAVNLKCKHDYFYASTAASAGAAPFSREPNHRLFFSSEFQVSPRALCTRRLPPQGPSLPFKASMAACVSSTLPKSTNR